jgi:hypothetical protein
VTTGGLPKIVVNWQKLPHSLRPCEIVVRRRRVSGWRLIIECSWESLPATSRAGRFFRQPECVDGKRFGARTVLVKRSTFAEFMASNAASHKGG